MLTDPDLNLEDLGYRDGRLDRPPAYINPHYQRGYRLGERVLLRRYRKGRLHHGQTFDHLFQAFQLIKESCKLPKI
ncbi:MAG: hypothetical protein HC881_03625 [Leptolyngbyaceae cyanobacterium SL_7_1]|nr:hypothetical protein [Leptolyngbyaceae cyanobacterium SL_7_1]